MSSSRAEQYNDESESESSSSSSYSQDNFLKVIFYFISDKSALPPKLKEHLIRQGFWQFETDGLTFPWTECSAENDTVAFPSVRTDQDRNNNLENVFKSEPPVSSNGKNRFFDSVTKFIKEGSVEILFDLEFFLYDSIRPSTKVVPAVRILAFSKEVTVFVHISSTDLNSIVEARTEFKSEIAEIDGINFLTDWHSTKAAGITRVVSVRKDHILLLPAPAYISFCESFADVYVATALITGDSNLDDENAHHGFKILHQPDFFMDPYLGLTDKRFSNGSKDDILKLLSQFEDIQPSSFRSTEWYPKELFKLQWVSAENRINLNNGKKEGGSSRVTKQ